MKKSRLWDQICQKNTSDKNFGKMKIKIVISIYNQLHNILRLFDVTPNFPFTTSERCPIITYKHGIYELRRELPNDLRLRTSGN